MRTVELQMVTGPAPANVEHDLSLSDSDDVGENTHVEAPATPDRTEPTCPVTVNVDAIRCAYPRKNNKPGTRLTFTDGGGFAVLNSYEDVKGYIATH